MEYILRQFRPSLLPQAFYHSFYDERQQKSEVVLFVCCFVFVFAWTLRVHSQNRMNKRKAPMTSVSIFFKVPLEPSVFFSPGSIICKSGLKFSHGVIEAL